MFGWKKTTLNLLIAAIIFTILLGGAIYLRQVKIAFIFLLVDALLWTVFAEELRIQNCEAKCGSPAPPPPKPAPTPPKPAPAPTKK
jgi:hypothetical protein